MSFEVDNYLFKSDKLLRDISKTCYTQLKLIQQPITIKKGEVIYRQGDKPNGVYYLVEGKVKIEQSNKSGDIRVVYIYIDNEFFGFRTLMSEELQPVTAIALEESKILFYRGEDFKRIVKASPTLSLNMIEILGFEFNMWVNLITALSHKSAKERIAFVLLLLHEKYKRSKRIKTEITLTKLDIGRYSETTEETVVRVLKFFEEQKFVKTQGRTVSIINKRMLEIIAEEF
ncbi:MAG: Crp/Fnr family transcriptional regulator [Cyclobacteriaceae bacterium]|nr:Crp/Fnr family transcriptional regulator [Cyclobacteriaceae bacterium]